MIRQEYNHKWLLMENNIFIIIKKKSMKLTLELGMLIICVLLLLVLVASQYTKKSGCADDVKEGFVGVKAKINNEINEQNDIYNNKNIHSVCTIHPYWLKKWNDNKSDADYLRKYNNVITANCSDRTRYNCVKEGGRTDLLNNSGGKRNNCYWKQQIDEKDKMEAFMRGKELTKSQYSDRNKNEIRDILFTLYGSIPSTTDDYLNYCKLRQRVSNCTPGINYCKDECPEGQG